MTKDVELELIWKAETRLAYLVTNDELEVWLPKSQVEIEDSAITGIVCSFLIPEWLAIEKGLV